MSKERTAGAVAVEDASVVPEMLKNLQNAIPSAKNIRINVATQLWIDKATNVREVRDNYSDEELDDFSGAIRAVGGVIHPVIVAGIADLEETDHKPYSLIDGFRRCLTVIRMAEKDGDPSWLDVPAILVDEAESTAAVVMLQLLVNLGRKGMTHMEQAKAIGQAMAENKELRQRDVAAMLGMKETDVSKLLKLNQLPDELQMKVQDGNMPYSHAVELVTNVPASAWKDVAKFAEESTFTEFRDKILKLYPKSGGPAASTDEDGATAGATTSDGDQQKRTSILKSTQLENTYIPFLKQELEKADKTTAKYTDADLISARLDTLNTVALKADTSLAKAIEPFIKEQQRKEEEEKANRDANTKKDKFYHDLLKDVNAVLETPVDPAEPNKPRPTLSDAFAAVVQKVLALTPEQVTALGFPLDRDPGKLVTELSTAYMEREKEKREEKARKAKKKEEEEAKKREEEAKAAAAAPSA